MTERYFVRVCGSCGQAGHNKRTCKAVVEHKADARSAGNEPKPKNISDDIDEETREAIEWYMETKYPGWKEWQKNRPAQIPDEDE